MLRFGVAVGRGVFVFFGVGFAVGLFVFFGAAVARASFALTAVFVFIFASVCFPTLPSALSPFAFWKAFTAASVAGPKSPSALPL